MNKKYKNYLGRNLKSASKPDALTVAKRSGLMAKIKSKETKLELTFIEHLRTLCPLSFSANVRSIKGKPDIVFEQQRICVFLDSDFWHGWQYPRWKHKLKNDFWREKIENNRRRDRNTTQYLRRNGWNVLRLWEHLIKQNPSLAVQKILEKLSAT